MTTDRTTAQPAPPHAAAVPSYLISHAPFLHSLEPARTIYIVTQVAACGPLVAGLVFFGWRAAIVAALAIVSCAVVEKAYYRCTYTPALLGRSHAYLTGLLLALTLPPFVPWYVPILAAVFAIVVGKAIFGGVGHFLWQPALIGRLAVAVMFPATMNPTAWPVLAPNKLLVGDVRQSRPMENYRRWSAQPAPPGADAFALPRPTTILGGLTTGAEPAFSGLATKPENAPPNKGLALMRMPPLTDLFYGATPGGIGETCSIAIVLAAVYLIYRGYVKWQLPVAIVLSAAAVVAVAPIRLAGAGQEVRTVWLPLLAEGSDAGLTYVCYQLFSGELLLAAVFMATEMTSRPVTTGGQVIFGVGCGTVGALLKLYLQVPIPFYMGVLAMNTFTPAIDSFWRPRVLGQKRFRLPPPKIASRGSRIAD
jgi:electron transport complex protein RnfD